ncbi:MAG TPA: hypothetical protein PLE73_02640 [Spirochaetota bacterium]|nr:hypothetical protein [Spirochaetota bacterium]HPI22065.1 hypothetical protein [Spirochaetota bacterium]HPU86798.1 hypothetical protein [Spirochaetota bacterium]
MIKTTINIHVDTLGRVSAVAGALNMPRRDIIVALLMRIMKHNARFRRGFSTVTYQPDDPRGVWRCFSISFKKDENEFFVDLRKVCKRSVSYLVAIAVEEYLDDFVAEHINGMHNYAPFRHYVLRQEVIDDVICWHCYWGNPYRCQKTTQTRL